MQQQIASEEDALERRYKLFSLRKQCLLWGSCRDQWPKSTRQVSCFFNRDKTVTFGWYGALMMIARWVILLSESKSSCNLMWRIVNQITQTKRETSYHAHAITLFEVMRHAASTRVLRENTIETIHPKLAGP